MSNVMTPADFGVPDYEGTYLDFLGFGVLEAREGFVRMRMPLKRHHTNTLEMAHGGIIMSMLDIAGAFSAHVGQSERIVSVTTTQTTSFIRSVTGPELIAEGRVIRRTRRTAFTQSVILDPSLSDDPDEQIAATAQFTFLLRQRGLYKKLTIDFRLKEKQPWSPVPAVASVS
ncbi:MAG: PaaI family thioesterase, partial [Pseudomonadota bacterium]